MAKRKGSRAAERTARAPKLEMEDQIEDVDFPEEEPQTMAQAAKANTAKATKATKKAAAAPKMTPEQRRTKRQAEDAATRSKGEVIRTQSGKATARGLPCLCGCGLPTVTDEARFVSGHDAKFRSRVLEGEQTLKSKDSHLIRPFFEAGEVIAGLMLEGGELVDVHAAAK